MTDNPDESNPPEADSRSIPSSVKDEYDVRERVDEYDGTYRLKMTATRGTGTRDENTVLAEARGESVEDLDRDREGMREMVIEEMEHLRMHQPDDDLLTPDDRETIAELLTDAEEALEDGEIDIAFDTLVEARGDLIPTDG